MQFRTDFLIPSAGYTISHSEEILTAGSCFAEVIGGKLEDFKFKVNSNPFGTIFNPLSLEKLLLSSLYSSSLPDVSFINTRGAWFNYHLHSGIYANSKKALQLKIEAIFKEVELILKNGNLLILTLGTANVYKFNETGETVSNCHKMPIGCFTKELLSPEIIFDSLKSLCKNLHTINPKLRIIITVSPVRHIKDSIPLNSVSKSILRYAAHLIQSEFEFVHYFPASEILLDDLRDYRFYKEDLIHPTSQAEEYIWEKFSDCFFSKETIQLNKQWSSLKKAIVHKPLFPGIPSHKAFLEDTLTKLIALSKSLPLDEEISAIKNQLDQF